MKGASSRHLVDPELLAMIEFLPRFELNADTLPQLRRRPAWVEVDPDDLDRTDIAEFMIPGPAGSPDVAVSVYRPRKYSGSLPCMLHIHGGGFVMGSALGSRGAHLPLAADLECCIVSVDYRLAPETIFPGAIEDCYAALRWLNIQAEMLGVDRSRIGVMGESAGGGLAAALTIMVRDRDEFTIAFQHLIYPMLDDRTCVIDPAAGCGEFVWTPEHNHFGWASLLGCEPGSHDVSGYAAAARTVDLAGLPATYIAVGALDLFLSENLEYAARLARSSVPIEVNVYPGAFHAFNVWPTSRTAARARDASREALRRSLRP